MSYKVRYASEPKYPVDKRPKGVRGIKPNPEFWDTDEARILFDMRYAWMKHKAQASYRGEEHSLTLDEWMDIWTPETFVQRGRTVDSYCLYMDDFTLGWHKDNVIVGLRSEYLVRAKEYRANNCD